MTPGHPLGHLRLLQDQGDWHDEKSKAINEADIQSTSLLLEDVLVIAMGETALTPGNAQNSSAEDKAKAATPQPRQPASW